MNMVKYLIFALILLATGTAFAIPRTYQVYVNTSPIAGQSGYLDFQFNPGNNSLPASASILNFNAYGGTLGPVNPGDLMGDVTGTLPGPVTFSNRAQVNDYFQSIKFGSFLSFTVDTPAGSGSSFGFGMFDNLGDPKLTTDPNGFAFILDYDRDNNITPTFFPASLGGSSVVTASAVPEPSTFALLGLGLAGATVLRKKTRTQ